MKIYTPNEVADELGVDRRTVHKLINTGQLRAKKIGPRTTRITEEALQAFLKADGFVECDRAGCDRPATKKIGVPHDGKDETLSCDLHWVLDYRGRLSESIEVHDLSDHQPDTKEVSV